ncbi:MAG: HesA/MoeB/ThiF family protein [Lachnospiraceae bacterium]
MEFGKEQMVRYQRHLVIDEIGRKGQQKLFDAKVLVIGAGGLGSPAALYLAAAGTGTLGIADPDQVELSNLQRQIMHTTDSIGKPKAESAERAVKAVNPYVKVNIYKTFADKDNIMDLIEGYDFIIDATDNFSSKFLINDACVKAKKAFSHAGVTRFQGQLFTYVPGISPCYRCLFKEPPPEGVVPTGNQAGILGAVCGTAGSLQAMEAVKYITGAGGLLTGRMLVFDALDMKFRIVKFQKDKDCKVCSV